MKKYLFLLGALLPMLSMSQERIMVIADPHVMASSLHDDGAAFTQLMEGQRKMIDLSEQLWLAAIDTALAHQPQLVLIPGDLTKDSEKASHQLVIGQLQRLHDAGIKTLVIPGNHDIECDAMSYLGEEAVSVESLQDDEWESTYDWAYRDAVKDADSHSYAAEPIEGVTVLGIDGSHKSAGTGSLSDATLDWVLQQADRAHEKGNMIIAMCHWQLLEDFDMKGMLEGSCRLQKADSIRDCLFRHHVHLVLTGHFHVNAITTYRDTLSADLDSIVEITTGSLITYPCPYRWLTVDKNREQISVETEYIRSLQGIDDLTTYSREWMREHATNKIPEMALRGWRKADEALEIISSRPEYGGEILAKLLKLSMPQTDEEKIALVERNFGSTVIELYLLYSDANEPEHPEADSLAQEVYTGMENMIHEMTDATMGNKYFQDMQDFLISTGIRVAHEPVQSLVEDVTNWKSQSYSDRTDDLHLTLRINQPRQEAIEQLPITNDQSPIIYDILGRPVSSPSSPGIYIQNGRKMINK